MDIKFQQKIIQVAQSRAIKLNVVKVADHRLLCG